MFKILKNAWSVPDLRKKILIVLGLLLVFRFGSSIPVPGINADTWKLMFENGGNEFLNLFNIFGNADLR